MTRTLHALLREHAPFNTARADGYYEATGIQCKCDGVWRAPSTFATHLAGAILDEFEIENTQPTDPEST
jgi:hypothetical protein